MRRRIVAIGECMIEFAREADGRWRQGFAGDTLNAAWAMRALIPPGWGPVSFFTRVGSDVWSERMVAFLQEADLDTRHIGRDTKRSVGLYTIDTDADGERSFSYWRSQSAARLLAADENALSAAVSDAGLVYFSGITLAILPPADRMRLLSALGKRGARTFRVAFDPNLRPALWEGPDEMRATVMAAAAEADIVLPTHEDETAAFGDRDAAATLARYRAAGAPEVVVRQGVRPTLWSAGVLSGAEPVREPVRPVDTTGAGDAFSGAYLARRLAGSPPAEAVRTAQRVAARVIRHPGALIDFALIAEAAASPTD